MKTNALTGASRPDQYIVGVNIEYDHDKGHLKMHYGRDKTDNSYIRKEVKEQLDKKLLNKPYEFISSNQNQIERIGHCTLIYIEDGLFFIERSSFMGMNSDCDKPAWQSVSYKGQENYYILMGKDKNRVKELMNDLEQIKELTTTAKIKKCEYQNMNLQAKNPLPEKGMSDATLQADITNAVKNGVAARGWTQDILYAYPMDKEWRITRNNSTGVIVKRQLYVAAIMKTDLALVNGNKFL